MSDNQQTTAQKWGRTLALASIGVGVVYLLTFVYASLRAKFTVPYVDDWSWVASLGQNPWTEGLWRSHNEHMIVIPRIMVWLDLWIWGWPGYATWAAGLASHLVMAAVVWWACRDREQHERWFLGGTILFLLFLTYELQGVVFPSSVNFPLVAVFATLSLAALAHGAEIWRERPHSAGLWRWCLAAAVLSVASMLCLTNGIVVPVILAAMTVVLRLPISTTIAMLLLAGAFPLVRYVLGGMPGSVLTASPIAVAKFAMAMLAGPIASVSPPAAVVVGLAYATGLSLATVSFLRTHQRSAAAGLLLGLGWFVLMSAAMAALGRAQFDLSVGAESRYVELAALGWASLFTVGLPRGFLRRPVGVFLATTAIVIVVLGVPLQILVGRVWALKADHLDIAGLVLAVGVSDPAWEWRLHPLGADFIRPALPTFQARGVDFLSFKARGAVSGGGAQCSRPVYMPVPASPQSGVRVHGRLEERGSSLRVIDKDSQVQGLGKPSPVVKDPRASADDMVWAELRRLNGQLDATGEWLAFAGWGSGPPYRVELLDTEGHVVCQAPVECCTPVPPLPKRGELIVRGGMVEGFVDTATCSGVTGWAWDSLRPDQPVEISLSVSNGAAFTVTAADPRPGHFGAHSGEHQSWLPRTASRQRLSSRRPGRSCCRCGNWSSARWQSQAHSVPLIAGSLPGHRTNQRRERHRNCGVLDRVPNQ